MTKADGSTKTIAQFLVDGNRLPKNVSFRDFFGSCKNQWNAAEEKKAGQAQEEAKQEAARAEIRHILEGNAGLTEEQIQEISRNHGLPEEQVKKIIQEEPFAGYKKALGLDHIEFFILKDKRFRNAKSDNGNLDEWFGEHSQKDQRLILLELATAKARHEQNQAFEQQVESWQVSAVCAKMQQRGVAEKLLNDGRITGKAVAKYEKKQCLNQVFIGLANDVRLALLGDLGVPQQGAAAKAQNALAHDQKFRHWLERKEYRVMANSPDLVVRWWNEYTEHGPQDALNKAALNEAGFKKYLLAIPEGAEAVIFAVLTSTYGNWTYGSDLTEWFKQLNSGEQEIVLSELDKEA
jgi:hypothetical protein